MKKPIVINLYGGPGCGKSTMAARIFSELKNLGICAELVCEYAKDLTWQKSQYVLNNQIHIFGEQQHRLWRVRNDVDIIVTDSPLLLTIMYNNLNVNKSQHLNALAVEEYNKYINIDIILSRTKNYETRGRNQSLDEAKQLDEEIQVLVHLHNTNGFLLQCAGDSSSIEFLMNHIKQIMSEISTFNT